MSTIVLLGITEASGGNVLGIGLADFIPASVANGIDWQKTYVNCFTAGPSGVRRSRMPMVLPDEDVVHQGGAVHVRPRHRRAQAGRAHPHHPAPHAVLGERAAAPLDG